MTAAIDKWERLQVRYGWSVQGPGNQIHGVGTCPVSVAISLDHVTTSCYKN